MSLHSLNLDLDQFLFDHLAPVLVIEITANSVEKDICVSTRRSWNGFKNVGANWRIRSHQNSDPKGVSLINYNAYKSDVGSF